MRNKLFGLVAASLLLPVAAFASSDAALQHANIDVHDHQSLQNGARLFMNYCQGCHGLSAARYNRLARDMGIPVIPENVDAPESQADAIADANSKMITDNLIFTREADGKPSKLGGLMKSAIPKADAAKWFGAAPPDLSLTGRSRGADWIYSYLKSFYLDPKRPTGVNNTVFPNVGMPHVLWELQGWQELEHHAAENGGHESSSLKLVKAGKMSEGEYDQSVRDITNFLAYVSEPAQLHRTGYGIFAMVLLLIFTVLAYLLKKEYWKDIH